MSISEYKPSFKAEAFLASVTNAKYDRQIVTGLQKFFDGKAPEYMRNLYSAGELSRLRDLRGTPKDVESRMPVKVTRHSFPTASMPRFLTHSQVLTDVTRSIGPINV
jgi:hypothetical protein